MVTRNPKSQLLAFFEQVWQSYKKGVKRDVIKDCSQFLKIANIKWQTGYAQEKITDIPTIITANHYVRPIFIRKYPFTTLDSMISSAIVALGVSKLSKRKITWVVKNKLTASFLFFSVLERRIQPASVYCYDLIGIPQNYPFGEEEKWLKFLEAGYNIGVYPEGKTGQFLQKNREGFEQILAFLFQKGLIFQILPVSFYYDKGVFKAHFGRVIKPNKNPEIIMAQTMANIAKNLPENLRGVYNNLHRGSYQPSRLIQTL